MLIEKSEYEKHLISLEKLVDLHVAIKDMDISLSTLYPVAIVKNNYFIIFDYNEKSGSYFFVKKCPAPMPVPKGIKAAFQLQEYDNKMTAVLSADTFDSIEGYVVAFHEFVHCYQQVYEGDLKKNLEVYQEAMNKNDPMWEINHPFPYEDEIFTEKTNELETFFNKEDGHGIHNYYAYMKNYLHPSDYEYMIWQQWKEGYARYIENNVRATFGLEKISREITEPYNRVSFYEIGSRTIDFIMQNENNLANNLEKLFHRML